MRANHYTQFIKPKDDRGVALILVLLAMLVLSVLAASIVFTARSETFASQNYKLDTQADYLAKAGIQRAINWLRSSHYRAITEAEAPTYYLVSSTGAPYNLYTSNTSQVTCISTCTTNNAYVQLIGYNNGTGTTNYPNINNTEAVARTVSVAFNSDLNDPALVNNRISADAANSGYFQVNAYLLNYQTVNVGLAAPYIPTPVETWLITSKATWTNSSSSATTVAVAEEQAIIQPIYSPTWGNALYGFCSVSMGGSAGTCTDSFNSALGPYGGGNASTASSGCDSLAATNVIDSGAGIGANGGVTLTGTQVSVGGNVSIGSGPTLPCVVSGFSGPVSDVSGEVINGPHKDPPPVPVFRSGFPGAAPSYALGTDAVQTLPTGAGAPVFGNVPWPNGSNSPPIGVSAPCMDATCNGSLAHPYEVNAVTMTGGGKGGNAPILNLIGGPDAYHPIYYDIASLSENQGSINVSGYVILNVQSGLSIGGNGISNGIASSIPPEAVQINYAGSSAVTINGNGAVSAVIDAPNASVNLGGGGSAGYMIGSIQAKDVSVMGGYPVHYDSQLSRVGGNLGTIVSTAYSRKKM